MSSSPSIPSPQTSLIETPHDRSPVTAETREQPQLETPSSPPRLRGFQQGSTNFESILDDLDRAIMAENSTSNDRRSPTTRRVANNHIRVRTVGPDPIVVAPSTPRVAVPPTPTNGNQQRLSIAGRILVFFGYGRNNRARKELVSLISSLVIDTSQVRHIVGCPTTLRPIDLRRLLRRTRAVLFGFGRVTDYRDYHTFDNLNTPPEPYRAITK